MDCYTKQPLIYLPGYINETVYSNQIESGWSWNAYQTINKQLEVASHSLLRPLVQLLDVGPSTATVPCSQVLPWKSAAPGQVVQAMSAQR